MKVIVAGFSKTGTKSIHVALKDLGYNVYDFLENFWFLGHDWEKILTTGGKVEDFKRMYEDVDVVVDSPANLFWKEIHAAFPDAKIVLTTRKDEDGWCKSLCNQFAEAKRNTAHNLVMYLSPTGRKYFKFLQNLMTVGFGFHPAYPGNWPCNELVLKKTYRQHCTDVLQNAPKDKLLVYDIREGWDPLCKFLGKDVPDKPFPHENVAGKLFDKLMKEHPTMRRMVKEMAISISIIIGLGAFGSYKMYQRWPLW